MDERDEEITFCQVLTATSQCVFDFTVYGQFGGHKVKTLAKSGGQICVNLKVETDNFFNFGGRDFPSLETSPNF